MFYWPIEEYTVLENILIIVLPLGWCLFLRWFCDPERWKKRREAAVADGSWLLAKGQDRTRPQELLSIKAFLRTQHEGLKLERTVEFVAPLGCIQYSQDSRTFVPSLNQEGPSNVVYENEEVRARVYRTRVAHSCCCLFSSANERMVRVRGFFDVPYAGR